MSRRFRILDVFTDQPLQGNPLAVVLDSEGLMTEGMQAIAREFNLSETVFLLPPEDPVNLARLRIFTPAMELPFAGHPTVGTAVLLALEHKAGIREDINFTLQEEVGLVPCSVRVLDFNRGRGRARFNLPLLPQRLDSSLDVTMLAAALSLAPEDIGCGPYEPGVFSAGVAFTHVPVRDLDAVARAQPDMAHWEAAFGPEAPKAFVYTAGGVAEDARFHARMFAPSLGIAEDPATGAAVAGFAGAIMAFDPPADGEHVLVIEQGFEMGRPSRLVLTLYVEGGALVAATIGGGAVLVASGELHV